MQDLQDKLAISALIQDWALWRDTGEWEKLRGTVHPDATMTATWFHGPFDAFIEACQRRGSRSMHFLGGTTVEINGRRAIAETRMTIMARTRAGAQVNPNLPTARGEALEKLQAEAKAWLAAG